MDILAGCAMGALVGLLIGLSNAPVVGAVVSALLALLVTFLGLGGAGPVKIDAKIERRLAGFCIFCVIALLLGVAARANQWFAPPLSSEIKAWTDAQASTEQAVMFVAFERLGILPAGETASNRSRDADRRRPVQDRKRGRLRNSGRGFPGGPRAAESDA